MKRLLHKRGVERLASLGTLLVGALSFLGGCSQTETAPPPQTLTSTTTRTVLVAPTAVQGARKPQSQPSGNRRTITRSTRVRSTTGTRQISSAGLVAASASADNGSLLLGNPSRAGKDANNYLLERPQFSLAYNQSQGESNWVAWHVQQSDIGRVKRGNFQPDERLPAAWQIVPTDYKGSGFDRGHVCPSGDRTSTRENNDATFVMSNMLPQVPALNQQVWAKLENYCRDQVRQGNELYIVAGGAGSQGFLQRAHVNIPQTCWKIIVVLQQGDNDLSRINAQTRVIAVNMPNSDTPEVGGARWAQYLTSVQQIEQATGYDFFAALPADVRTALKQKVDSGRGSRNSALPYTFERAQRGGVRGPPTADSTDGGRDSEQEDRASSRIERSAPADSSANSTQVWVNTNSGIYHYPGTRWYGNTKEGEYMSESEAQSSGYRAAQNGQ